MTVRGTVRSAYGPSSAERDQVLSSAPNKDYNFDTISIEVIVLIFYSKALIFKGFQHFQGRIKFRSACCLSIKVLQKLRFSLYFQGSNNYYNT